MKTLQIRIGTALAALLLLPLGNELRAQAQDTLVLKNGRSQSVPIASEDYDGVWYAIGKGRSCAKWKDVASVRYANATEFYKAVDAFQSGRLAEARPLLEKLAADDKLRAPLRQTVLFDLAVTLQRTNDPDGAIAKYQELMKAFPKSRFLLGIGTNLLGAYLSKGDAAGASKALDAFLAAAKSAEIDAAYQANFGLLKGRVFEEQKKYEDARAAYEAVAANEADPDVAAMGRLGVARCAQLRGAKADAEQQYRKIVGQDGPNVVLAGAWNGLGDLAFEDGMAKREPDLLRRALFAYLRGVVLYVPERDAPTDEFEHALDGASSAFRALGELEPDAENKKAQLERAKQLRSQLTAEFPASRRLAPAKPKQ